MTPSIIVIGASFVGRHLLAHFRRVGIPFLGMTRRPERGRPETFWPFDLERPDLSPLPIAPGQYQAAIIAAAVTKVDQCEREPKATWQINVTGTLSLIKQLLDRRIMPIFLSSDYVFDGTTSTGYVDDAPRCPTTEYGRQKAAVEEAMSRMPGTLVLRLSKIYSLERGDGTLLDEIAMRLESGQTYSAAYDQKFNPTCVADLAPAISNVLNRGLTGIVNLCAPEAWSRYDIAIAVARRLGVSEALVRRISLDDLPGVRRPKTTALIPRRLLAETDVTFTTLTEALPRLKCGHKA